MDNGRGRISWRAVFGKDKYQMAAIFRKLHDDLEKEVGQKWGLERGNDIATTKARHRSISEYRHDLISEVTRLKTTKEDLLKQIHRAEIKLKGISTMIANLHTRKEEVQKQIDLIARQFGQDGVDNADLAMQMLKLRKEMESIDEKLALRKNMLDDADDELDDVESDDDATCDV
jgi:chromosome segregation ATPase